MPIEEDIRLTKEEEEEIFYKWKIFGTFKGRKLKRESEMLKK